MTIIDYSLYVEKNVPNHRPEADLCPNQIALEGVAFALANGRCVAATLGPVAFDLLLRRRVENIKFSIISSFYVSNFFNG